MKAIKNVLSSAVAAQKVQGEQGKGGVPLKQQPHICREIEEGKTVEERQEDRKRCRLLLFDVSVPLLVFYLLLVNLCNVFAEITNLQSGK